MHTQSPTHHLLILPHHAKKGLWGEHCRTWRCLSGLGVSIVGLIPNTVWRRARFFFIDSRSTAASCKLRSSFWLKLPTCVQLFQRRYKFISVGISHRAFLEMKIYLVRQNDQRYCCTFLQTIGIVLTIILLELQTVQSDFRLITTITELTFAFLSFWR